MGRPARSRVVFACLFHHSVYGRAMSLLFMLVALLGAVLVLAGGSYALRRVLDRPKRSPEVGGGATITSLSHVGGYVPAPRVPEELSSSLCTRVRDLVALGRREEA